MNDPMRDRRQSSVTCVIRYVADNA